MATAQINRSLTNIRTELEFLLDSEVIDTPLFDTLMASLPKRFSKDDSVWGLDKANLVQRNANNGASEKSNASEKPNASEKFTSSISVLQSVSETAAALSNTSLNDVAPPQYPPAPLPTEKILEYSMAMYNFESREIGDLLLSKGDKVAVVEYMSADWWRGYKQGQLAQSSGIFPSNYVSKISEAEFNDSGEKAGLANARTGYDMPQSVTCQNSGPYQQQPQMQQQMPMQQQPSYGGYSQYQSAPMNYGPIQPQQQQFPPYQQQQQQQPVQQQPEQQPEGGNKFGSAHPNLSKFGSKLGNAAIFGAGATLGSDLVNRIF